MCRRYFRLFFCLFVCVFLLSGCSSRKDHLLELNDRPEAFRNVVKDALPAYSLLPRQDGMLRDLRDGAVVEMTDVTAQPALSCGLARFWYPLYRSTVVLAVDRDQTAAEVRGWNDLREAGLQVGILPLDNDYRLQFSAIAYGLQGDSYNMNSAGDYLSGLADSTSLSFNDETAAVLICLDDQAAELKKQGRNLEIIVPEEGTLTFTRGLLSRSELALPDLSQALLAAGCRLPDNRCDAALYPSEASYASAAGVVNAKVFNQRAEHVTRILRRQIQNRRFYSSADQEEHILFAVLFCVLVLIWMIGARNRAMQAGIRKSVLLTGICLIGWASVRLIKFQVIGKPPLTSYLWYSYYFFMLALSGGLLYNALRIDHPKNRRIRKAGFAIFLVNTCLVLLTATNNLHHLVFRFRFDDPEWSGSYRYAPMYFVIYAVMLLEIISAILFLVVKSRTVPRRMAAAAPVFTAVVFFTYSICYILRIPPAVESDFSITCGILTIFFYESAMQSGLVPVNTMYTWFFRNSPLHFQILGRNGRTLRSVQSDVLPEELAARVSAGESPLLLNEDTMLYADAITCGTVVREENIRSLNRLNAKLRSTQKRLLETNRILSREEAARERMLKAEERETVYAHLEQEIRGRTEKLSDMIRALPGKADQRLEKARITLLLCFIKRRCNLYFCEQMRPDLPAMDLMVYFDELADFAGYAGVVCTTASAIETNVPIQTALLLYGFFYEVLEWESSGADGAGGATLMERLSEPEGAFCLGLFPSMDAHAFRLSAPAAALAEVLHAEYRILDLDNSTGIRLLIPKPAANDQKGAL